MFRSGSRNEWSTEWLAELRGSGEVPHGAIGLPLERATGILRAGEELPGRAILVPVGSVILELSFPALADRDGIAATLELTVEIDPPDGGTGLRLLAESLGKEPRYSISSLEKLLVNLWRDALALRVSRGSWTDDGELTERLELSNVPDTVLEALFDRGLRFDGVRSAAASSEALTAAKESRRQRREEAARIRERLDFLDLWKKEEQGEALAREEVERMAAHLRQQGLLRKIGHDREEHLERLRAHEDTTPDQERLNRRLERERLISKVEIDGERLDQELAQSEKLRAAFEKNGWLALVRAIEDPDGRTRLLERLIEKEMTPEQIAARGVASAQVDRLEARIESLQQHLERRGIPEPLAGMVRGLRPTHRVWMAAGLALYRIDGDPATADREARPVLPPEEIGYLRSVRIVRDGLGGIVAVGGQGGVGLYRPNGSHWEFYRFRPGESGRGGANAVDPIGHQVLASHSRLGLSLWRRNDPQSLTRPFQDRLVPGRSTRAAQAAPDGGWWFGHGAEIFHVAPGAPEGGLTSLGSLPESVTALCGAHGELWAGTQEGRLFRHDALGKWIELPFATSGPIYQIVAPPTDGEPVWIVGARQPAVHVLDRRGGKLADYRCRYPVRWVGAGAGGPIAVDRFGQHLIVWSWDVPQAPVRRIRVTDQIHSIAVEEEDA